MLPTYCSRRQVCLQLKPLFDNQTAGHEVREEARRRTRLRSEDPGLKASDCQEAESGLLFDNLDCTLNASVRP
jgi:hypothetical protein